MSIKHPKLQFANSEVHTPYIKEHNNATAYVYHADNLSVLETLQDESFDLIYIDPPFNTGQTRVRPNLTIERDDDGDRIGYRGRRYRTVKSETVGSFNDIFTIDRDFLTFLAPRLQQARRLLSKNGAFFLHIDYREVHYCKVLLDTIFGRKCFVNEIIWAYDYGSRTKKRWPTKHDNILWYVKNPASYTYRVDDMDRIPYLAPKLVGEEKAKRGKTPTDVWWQTIVSPTGKEKTGYPTQKPIAILERIIKIHSNPGDLVLDFFAGSGTTGVAALNLDRNVVLVDENPDAINVIKKRMEKL